jgi:hypothetical protein
MDLDELSPVDGRAAGGRPWWRFEWFTQVRENLASRGRSHPGLRPRANLRFEVSRLLPAVFSEPDVAAAVWALEGKLLTPPAMSFAHAIREVSWERGF